MVVPWLRILDLALGVTNIARVASSGRKRDDPAASNPELEISGIEAARLDLARQQLAAEQRRADRALHLELQRQAADREIGRLRLIAGVSIAAWIGTMVWLARAMAAGIGARVTLSVGWMFLLGAIAVSFIGQSRAAARVDALAIDDEGRAEFRTGLSAGIALWLCITGLVFAGFAALIAR
jgi:hypothetical protein